mgnify:CR=1 FL=1|tara:strand:+ start:3090 stop:3620 length:531 start_codon:yes stop_codon:yes gene_type:complete
MRSLLELTDRFLDLHDRVIENSGVLDEETAMEMESMLKNAGDSLNTKVDGYCQLIRELELRSEARKSEADRLAKRARVDKNAAKSLKDLLCMSLDCMGQTSIETDNHKVSIGNAGGSKKLILAEDLNSLTESDYSMYVKEVVDMVFDKEAVRAALADGKKLSFAKYDESPRVLRIL